MTTQTAEEKYYTWKSTDPFPSIKPTLLNSADIEDYVVTTGMLDPFRTRRGDEDKLKAASYEADLFGRVIYWDEKGARVERDLRGRDDKFVLKRNSIAFVEIEPTFRLPNYIAARFNLKILHVHRGILLGTGPLIDPGFQGKLLIPLHNLTYNNYTFHGEEGLIWIEFTKLDWPLKAGERQEGDAAERRGKFVEFPPRKLARKDPNDYLGRASSPYDSIRSSIPPEVNEAKKEAERARKIARNLAYFSSFSVLIAIITAGMFLVQVSSFVEDVQQHIVAQSQRISSLQEGLGAMTRELEHLKDAIRRNNKPPEQVKSPSSSTQTPATQPLGPDKTQPVRPPK